MPCGWESNRGVGLASHWPRVTWFSNYGLKAYKRELSTHLRSLVEHGRLYLTFNSSTAPPV